MKGRPKRAIPVDGAALTDARIKAGKSLQDVAEACGRDRSTVSRWERGVQIPSAEDVLKMLKCFGVDRGIVKMRGGENGK